MSRELIDAISNSNNVESETVFKDVADKNNIKDYDSKIASKLISYSAPVIIKLKKHFNRPRPKVIAKKMNIDMKDYEMKSMKTPSYPSGHSTQGMLIGLVLADKYPNAAKTLKKLPIIYLKVET